MEFPDQQGSETQIRDPVLLAGRSHGLFGPSFTSGGVIITGKSR